VLVGSMIADRRLVVATMIAVESPGFVLAYS
jgi:hypothetical protein